MQAIAMVAQILQRHVHAMQNSPTCLTIDTALEQAAAELPDPHQQADNDTMRLEITRALFAEPNERCMSPPLPPLPATTPATLLPVLPTSLVRPMEPALLLEIKTHAALLIVAADCAHDAWQLSAPAKSPPPPVSTLACRHEAVHAAVYAAAALK